jgi:PHP family Zn ribbon phosphoesterase
LSPQEAKKNNNRCPKCGKPLTIGVVHRVDELADRKEGFIPANAIPFKSMVPLDEIIADAKQLNKTTVAVEKEYRMMLARFGTEFDILMKIPEEELKKNLNPKIAEAITRVRAGKVKVEPGYDGEYGKVSIFGADEKNSGEAQMNLF